MDGMRKKRFNCILGEKVIKNILAAQFILVDYDVNLDQ
jgi:hypothetical protein